MVIVGNIIVEILYTMLNITFGSFKNVFTNNFKELKIYEKQCVIEKLVYYIQPF